MPSFDVVSSVNLQEVRNAVDQVRRELGTRFDFRGSKSAVELQPDNNISVIADDKMKLHAIQDLLKQKLAKRGVSPKLVKFEDAVPGSSDTLRQQVTVKQGLNEEELRKLNKSVKASNLKISSQIQGNQIRVSGKKKDDLQAAIQHLRGSLPELDLQFLNFRD